MKERVVSLISGGIDSPVSCVIAAKNFEIIPLHFCAFPYTSEDMLDLTIGALKSIKRKTRFKKAIIYPWAEILNKMAEFKCREFTCLVCKRSMLKAAELVCEREEAKGIVTGESLGQKASQTLSNLTAISSGTKLPIMRPLLGLDKQEIERMSKEFGVWQAKHAGNCSAVPRHPRTRSSVTEIDEFFKRLNLDRLIRKKLKDVIELRTFKEDLRPLFLENL